MGRERIVQVKCGMWRTGAYNWICLVWREGKCSMGTYGVVLKPGEEG